MILDGRAVAQKIEEQLKSDIAKTEGRKPGLVFIRVGDDPASLSYVRSKSKKCAEIGIFSADRAFSANISLERLLEEINLLNHNESIDGILVQLPLPSHINPYKVFSFIDPTKDVDGFHPLNVGKLFIGESDGFFPCTPYGIVTLLLHANIDPSGKQVVILGRSNIVGKPLAALLVQKRAGANATVTIAHSQSRNLKTICQTADILVVAMGSPHFVTEELVKPNAVVIDVGINRRDGKIVGDVDFIRVAPKCVAITPVPGGVGPMTIAMLLSNTFLSFQRRNL
jgi:methylenetetrahydrofolate dehydrogenase (NADP+) / methenyltetrahydrofolate cyclohydrolase